MADNYDISYKHSSHVKILIAISVYKAIAIKFTILLQ